MYGAVNATPTERLQHLISSALVGGNVHKLGKDSIRKSLKVALGGSILEDIFLPILEKCLFSSPQWF